ncbi:hypothetical protein AB0J86_01135 [Micromonospora sp. NPDC049559]|uniref:hypothetical protein n=1 Tax=Micromonospora sp. NPDC049559 TaxID=3155923 RepID=UPI00343A4311
MSSISSGACHLARVRVGARTAGPASRAVRTASGGAAVRAGGGYADPTAGAYAAPPAGRRGTEVGRTD